MHTYSRLFILFNYTDISRLLEFYIPYFRKTGVTAVVRLNKRMYDKRRFTDHGINHYDLYFVDGGVPTEAVVKKFLEISEREEVFKI
jgi:cell division cycle 14